jgi:hypothetical protein
MPLSKTNASTWHNRNSFLTSKVVDPGHGKVQVEGEKLAHTRILRPEGLHFQPKHGKRECLSGYDFVRESHCNPQPRFRGVGKCLRCKPTRHLSSQGPYQYANIHVRDSR